MSDNKNTKREPIELSSNTPLVQEYDGVDGYLLGSFLDQMKHIGAPCLLYADEPFFIASEKGYFHKEGGNYERIGAHGKDLMDTADHFIQYVVGKVAKGFLIVNDIGAKKKYKPIIRDHQVKFVT